MLTIRNTALVLVTTIAFGTFATFVEAKDRTGPKKNVAAGKTSKGST